MEVVTYRLAQHFLMICKDVKHNISFFLSFSPLNGDRKGPLQC